MKRLGRFILKLGGFRLYNDFDVKMKNAVIIEAPHTSMWDFVIGRAGLWGLGINCHFLIKKELFFFPLGFVLRGLGAVPVNRGKDGKGFFDDIIKELKDNKNFSLVLTPEGTRKRTNNWKKGYYFIAQQSNKPIFMAWIDYKKKECGINPTPIYPTGNYSEDFVVIEGFYRGINAKHPEGFNLTPKE